MAGKRTKDDSIWCEKYYKRKKVIEDETTSYLCQRTLENKIFLCCSENVLKNITCSNENKKHYLKYILRSYPKYCKKIAIKVFVKTVLCFIGSCYTKCKAITQKYN